jgi:hypothetical protein
MDDASASALEFMRALKHFHNVEWGEFFGFTGKHQVSSVSSSQYQSGTYRILFPSTFSSSNRSDVMTVPSGMLKYLSPETRPLTSLYHKIHFKTFIILPVIYFTV